MPPEPESTSDDDENADDTSNLRTDVSDRAEDEVPPDTNQDAETESDDAGEESAADCPEACLIQGCTHLEAGEWERAVEVFTAALRANPQDAEAYQQRARAYLELGKVNDALQDAEAAVRYEPEDAECYLVRGAALVKTRQFDPAIADLTRYLKEEDTYTSGGPRASRALYWRGLAYAGQGEIRRAVRDYSSAIHRWPDWPEPYEARAEAYDFLGKFKAAAADRKQAERRAAP